jgi:hypothetical protein
VEKIDPGAPGHLDVADDDVEVITFKMHQCSVDVACSDDIIALASEEDLEEFLHAAFVINDENASFRAQADSPV